MKIEIGVQEKGGRTFAELKRVSDVLNRAVPGLGKRLEVKEGMSEMAAITILSTQIAEILVSHSNLELAYARLELDAMRAEATVTVLQDEYTELKNEFLATNAILDRIVTDLTESPDEHPTLLDGALDNLVEYAYDTGNAGLSVTYTFKEGDLKRGLADAMHGFNIKVMNR